MNSKRLLAIASFINKNDKVIDVGCDHGYLGIYLKQNNLCSNILLTDLRKNALNQAISNINKYELDIDTFQTDGLENINLDKYDTVTLSGMGANTIIRILSSLNNNKSIKKIVIQSNNDLDILRGEMLKNGFFLKDEITIKENDIYYVICEFIKGKRSLSNKEILFGLNKEDKKDYYNYLLKYYKNILNKIPKENDDKLIINNKIKMLNELLKECR